MPKTRSEAEVATEQLVAAIVELGYPEEFGYVLASELGGPWSIRRLASYVRQAQPRSPEEIADEMVAILAHREAIVEKKMAVRSNAAYTAFLNRERDGQDD